MSSDVQETSVGVKSGDRVRVVRVLSSMVKFHPEGRELQVGDILDVIGCGVSVAGAIKSIDVVGEETYNHFIVYEIQGQNSLYFGPNRASLRADCVVRVVKECACESLLWGHLPGCPYSSNQGDR